MMGYSSICLISLFQVHLSYMYLLTFRQPYSVREDGCDQTQRTEAIPIDEDNMRHFIYDV
jgi:hypothetical protein